MKLISKGNFLLMEKSEFKDWLKQQAITRKIKTLQVHHTWRPNYSTRKNQDPFVCLEGMRNNHVINNGWRDIGQNFTIFENGQIGYSLGRGLNVTPAGIGGANTGALCIEIIGNFDIGGDKMSDEQKHSVIHLYACLAEKLKLPINTDTIPYHAWYDSSGRRLSDFQKGSAKTCPGTAFFGDGNTIAAANKNFIPLIKAEYERLTNPLIKDDEQPMTKEEQLAFEKLQEAVTAIEKRLNIHADQTYVSNYEKAVVDAKNADIITTSAEKSKIELNIIQMLYNAGLLNKDLIAFFKGFTKETSVAIDKLVKGDK